MALNDELVNALLKGDPVNALIRECLLEERAADSSFYYTAPNGTAYTLKWSLNNTLGLVFVAVYQKALHLTYVDSLLSKVNAAFSARYSPAKFSYTDFEPTFKSMVKEAEQRAEAQRPAVRKGPATSAASESETGLATDKDETQDDEDEDGVLNDLAVAGSVNEDAEPSSGFNTAALKKLGRRGPRAGKASETTTKPSTTKPTKPKGKQARTWDDALGSEPRLDASSLDYTEGGADSAVAEAKADFSALSLVDVEEEVTFEDDANEEEVSAQRPASRGFLSSLVRSMGVTLTGTSSLTREDVDAACKALKSKLMERNVAEEIAEKVCESVAAGLEGKRLGSFSRISAVVREAVEAALTRILTPGRSINILRGVREARGRGRPYTIVFVGVNGVGKSTNLAKVAYWLLQNGCSVMIAACDTFRSGAVEQLKTHCARLGVPLFERGYEKDPAKVALEASRAAARQNIDVLLVDTAGRMQDNEPLMRALSNLISINDPDLVLFVGEALVGNDAVDQLTKFNRRLAELNADNKTQRVIDGIILTKFDTIDDKVGAALSMVYTSGAPVVFVGCGQTYVDLKKLNVKSVVAALLK